MIQASVILGRNPEKYGFPTDLHPPLHYINVSVSKPIDLRAAAKVLNTSLEELRRLNPALKRLNTPPNYPDFQLKVPADSDPDIHAKLAALPKARTKTARDFDRRHKVRKGETLYSIAALYGVSIDELADANDIVSKNKIRAGRWLLVPSVGKKESKRLKTKRLDSSIKPTKSTASIQNARSGKDAQPDSSAARIKSTKSQQKTKRSGGKASF